MVDAMPGGLGEGIDTGQISESASEASEQDVVRVQESLQKAKNIQGKGAAQQKHDAHMAKLLTHIFQNITDEDLLSDIHQQIFEFHLPPKEICAQFLPFLYTKIPLDPRHDSFGELAWKREQVTLTVDWVIAYLRDLVSVFPAFHHIPTSAYIAFVYHYLYATNIIDIRQWTRDQKRDLLDRLETEFTPVERKE